MFACDEQLYSIFVLLNMRKGMCDKAPDCESKVVYSLAPTLYINPINQE